MHHRTRVAEEVRERVNEIVDAETSQPVEKLSFNTRLEILCQRADRQEAEAQ